ncbi:FMN reductase [Nakamurella deserti]|uniref:FMN reductase n=1 Tax=Nakamurella deserti TaxID=2164074 RepID=UPI000DBE8249|nr:FMN reductase [Nakamurella deserti]
MNTRHLAVVTAGLGQPSSTRLLADRLTQATVRRLAEDGITAEVTVVELRDHAHAITDNLLTGFAAPELAAAIDAVTAADGLIAVTPIFTTSYSGLFKSFVDVLDPTALTGQPVLLAATGGTPRHSLALDYAVRPLFSYLRARPLSTTVFAASEDWGSTASELPGRIERAAGELAAEMTRAGRTVKDPWALGDSFEDLLKGV